jgi:hypothetical protein
VVKILDDDHVAFTMVCPFGVGFEDGTTASAVDCGAALVVTICHDSMTIDGAKETILDLVQVLQRYVTALCCNSRSKTRFALPRLALIQLLY